MFESALLAGDLAAHAIWTVSQDKILTPIYGYGKEDNKRAMERLMHERLEEGVAAGMEKLDDNPYKSNSAVFIYDGRITLESGKFDAVIVEFRSYDGNPGFVKLAVPYRPASGETKFVVHMPKVFGFSDHLRDDFPAVFNKFYEGVDRHVHGSKVWKDHLDQSI